MGRSFLDLGLLDAVRYFLPRRAEGPQVTERDMQHAIAIMEVDGIPAAVTKRNRPRTVARLDSVHLTSK